MSSSERLTQIVTWGLAVALITAVAGAVVLSVVPLGPTEPNTELYLLGTDGSASGYQTNLSVNETGRVVVGVTNNEGATTDYTLVAHFQNRTVARHSFTLEAGATWNRTVAYTPQSVAEDRLVVDLYRGPVDGDPYRRVVLVLNVTR